MSLRDAARAVVKASALSKPGELHIAIERMARELALTADRDQLSADINARRRTDDVERMRQHRATFEQLLRDYADPLTDYQRGVRDLLLQHVYGETPEPPKTYLL